MDTRATTAIVAAFLLTACATVDHKTRSGKPEVTIPGATAERVKVELVDAMTTAGFSITRSNDYQLVFDRPTEGVMVALLLGSQYDAIPNARVSFTITELNRSVRVVADIKMVTNPGSAFERLTDWNKSKDAVDVQKALHLLQENLAQSASESAAVR